MKIFINKRKSGKQPGGKGGGWIQGGLERVAVLDEPPEKDMERFLYENYGAGFYAVSTQGPKGQFFSIFSGKVGMFEGEGELS